MNSFYNEEELKKIGFKKYGENVKISRKASIYSAEKISIGNNVRIDDFCIISGNIKIGNYVHIAAFSALFAGEAGIEFKDFSGVSSRVTVYGVSDDYSGEFMTNPTIRDEFRKITNKKVLIGEHCIVGASSVILPGVTLEEGVSIGACSLVNKNCKEWTVNIGTPIKYLKDRKKINRVFIKRILERN